MLYYIIPIVAAVAVYFFLPTVVAWLTKKRPQPDKLLALACTIYFVSWFLPSPLIHGQDTSFSTHFVGGGVFSGLLWLYLKKQLQWHGSAAVEFLSLYAFVCTLGVSNELFEWAIVQLKLVTKLNGADTWWDLLANTLGALLFWVIYSVSKLHKIKNQ